MAALSCSAAFVSGDPAPSSLARRALLSRGAAPPRTVALRAAVTPNAAAAQEAAAEGKRRPRGSRSPGRSRPSSRPDWAYIKENNLQDPENRRIIVCDEKLKNIFGGKERVGFLEISGLLNPHFRK
uniref:DM2 domain-containing protein n=1 Tax=Ananas comosus var. bracteatus TaxID=296719 RepID=A0A6V7PP05_ANACO|nr:unnamed protein product [Ananas comosus var. bracteatus]